ncbi:MAG TPA: sigma-70 family RNA polymerase sigma factor [Verrucomicrobiae bacterium]|nr:sigma-70 family RNA polymerase sigma factor [Verrucomicrobiae bacterium]
MAHTYWQMQPTDDSQLLRQYAENNSDEAFAALVARHINLVYSIALRQTANSHNAEEITQAVFIILAKKAGHLRHHQALSSWLFQVTRLTINNFVRSETRRRFREQEAHMQTILNDSDNEAWLKIAPLLDLAVARLREKDRQVILLRFYEGKNFCEIGSLLNTSGNAAEKRVKRALEKLRKYFSKHGVTSTATIIAGGISANSVHAAPVGLAKTISAVAISQSAAASASTLTLIKGALKIMAWTKAKTAAVTVILACIIAATTTIFGVRHARNSRNQIWTKDQIMYAGFATPQSAMKTLLWGISHGDANAVMECLTPTEKANAQKAFQGKFGAIVEAWSGRMTATNFQITVESGSSENVTIDLVSSGADGQKHERKYWFKKIGKEWKCDQVHPSFDLSN